MVGSNPITRSVIEDSYLRLLAILDRHIAGGLPFLMGNRPGTGELRIVRATESAHPFRSDPECDCGRARAASLFVGESHGGPRIDRGCRRRLASARSHRRNSESVALRDWPRVRAVFSRQRPRAQREVAEVRTEIDGRAWIQQPFPYQGKCLKWLREAYAALSENDRDFVGETLAGTGCEVIFAAGI